MNLLEVGLGEQGAQVGDHVVPVPRSTRDALGREGGILGFRPESVDVVRAGEGFPFQVTVVEELGSDAYAYGNLRLGGESAGLDTTVVARVDARRVPSRGETIHLRMRESEEHVFSAATGTRVATT